MPVQPDDFKALAAVAKYYVLTREQIQSICWPDQTSGRATRKRLLRLLNSGFLSRHSVPVALPEIGGAAPVYYAEDVPVVVEKRGGSFCGNYSTRGYFQ